MFRLSFFLIAFFLYLPLSATTVLYWQEDHSSSNAYCAISIPDQALDFSKQYPIQIELTYPQAFNFDNQAYIEQVNLLLPPDITARWMSSQPRNNQLTLLIESESPETTLVTLPPFLLTSKNQIDITFTPPPVLIDLTYHDIPSTILGSNPYFLSTDDEVLDANLHLKAQPASEVLESIDPPLRLQLLKAFITAFFLILFLIACISYYDTIFLWFQSLFKSKNRTFLSTQQELLQLFEDYKCGKVTYKKLCSRSLVLIKHLFAMTYNISAQQMTVEELSEAPLGPSQQLSDNLKKVLYHFNQMKFSEHAKHPPIATKQLETIFKSLITQLEKDSYQKN